QARDQLLEAGGHRHLLPVRAGLSGFAGDVSGRAGAGRRLSMDASLALQYLVIAAAVLASAWVAMRKLFPAAVRRLRVAIALPLVRETQPAWLRGIGRRIAPEPKARGNACGGCDGCD